MYIYITLSRWQVGCGVGNATMPLLAVNPELRIWASDFSDNAGACRVQGAGCRVQGAECRVQGSGSDNAGAPQPLTPNTVELIPTLGALFPRGGPVQDSVLTPAAPTGLPAVGSVLPTVGSVDCPFQSY